MRIVVAPEAWERLEDTLFVYAEYMGDAALARVRKQLGDLLSYLTEHPGYGAYEDLIEPSADGIRYRRAIVDHIKVVYKIVGDELWVTDIFDSRQDPRRMKG